MAVNPVQAQAQMHTQMAYAPPVLRPASPASSVGTVYPDDTTSLSDNEQCLSQAAFERKWEERLGLTGEKRKEEERAEQDPLLGTRGRVLNNEERRDLHTIVMANLRQEVSKLQEDELFDQILLRGSRAALQPQPTTSDIDTILKSMMSPSFAISERKDRPIRQHTRIASSQQPVPRKPAPPPVPGPWNHFGKSESATPIAIPFPTTKDGDDNGLLMSSSVSSQAAQVGAKRSRNGTSRSKRKT